MCPRRLHCRGYKKIEYGNILRLAREFHQFLSKYLEYIYNDGKLLKVKNEYKLLKDIYISDIKYIFNRHLIDRNLIAYKNTLYMEIDRPIISTQKGGTLILHKLGSFRRVFGQKNGVGAYFVGLSISTYMVIHLVNLLKLKICLVLYHSNKRKLANEH